MPDKGKARANEQEYLVASDARDSHRHPHAPADAAPRDGGGPSVSGTVTAADGDGEGKTADGSDGHDSEGAIRRAADLPVDAQTARARSRPRSPSPTNSPILNPPISNNVLDIAPRLLMPHHLKPLLFCQCCDPPALFDAPTTLHCGHTVCSSHVRSDSPAASSPLASSSSTPLSVFPACPLPSCSRSPDSQSTPAFSIPSSSRVVYRPAPSPTSLPTNDVVKVQDPKVDIVVSKVIGVLTRMDRLDKEDDTFVRTREEDECSDNEDSSGEMADRHPRPTRSPTPRAQDSANARRERSRSSSPPSPSRPPRKRRRRLHDLDSQAEQRSNVPRLPSPSREIGSLSARLEKELMAELTCEICYMLLYQPITTPCQHTFCVKCLHRSLDHSNACPLCRQDLPPFHYFQDHPYNQVLLAIILKAFPEAYAERGRTIEEEEKAARLDTPLFVCQLSFPGMPTLLHIFEPRYRLMLRRCLSSTPLFGMIMPPRSSASGSQTEYGTMLEIRSVQMLPDGRSMVETWGVWRFRILERAIVDGYLVGRIERIDDFPEELDGVDNIDLDNYSGTSLSSRSAPLPPPTTVLRSSSPPRPPSTNEELMAVCHGFLDQLRHGTAPWVVQRLSNTYGPMPTTASEFSFWMALVLPIDEHEKAKLLPIRSPRLRLRLVVHWIEQLNSNWYAGPFRISFISFFMFVNNPLYFLIGQSIRLHSCLFSLLQFSPSLCPFTSWRWLFVVLPIVIILLGCFVYDGGGFLLL
ncbi:hypothetical protein NEOLEDRAFT_1134878 [Neolentinus lepideus HHB14362 ss-1]|uniref:LON-domain-containing protein n=1 Tax=Neolentinus lepideus HHB14362 ss-1 TaxID=1314782 RepID=A0A165S0C7_9AGAM|nr:hypothetical protein NEOLEDRAFT_1134878 [Neolentinus lepideus HHB14362 ss-1]